MRVLHALTLSLLAAAGPVRADVSLDGARRLAEAGAHTLALDRVERLSPPGGDPRWAEWEALRLELLARTQSRDALAARVAALPQTAPRALRERALVLAAGSALADRDPAAARGYLTRLLWEFPLPAESRRDARRMVIESYLDERRPQEAYLAMLRFRQDYAPVAPGEAERFAAGLLALGRVNEAIAWLDALDRASPVRLALQLRAGLVTPAAAGEKAAAEAARDPRYWEVVAQAASLRGDRALQLEARERMLNAAARPTAESVRELWRAYGDYGRQQGNERQLLLGDDAAWAALAEAASAGRHSAARALWALLAAEARTPLLREQATARLLALLDKDGLERAALALFGAGSPAAGTQLGPEARYRLGAMAARLGWAKRAVDWWRGMAAPPPGVAREAWQLSLAQAQAAGGAWAESAATLRALLGRGPLPESAVEATLELARQLLEAGQTQAAAEAAAVLLRQTQGERRRAAALLAAGAAERRGEPRAAAEYLLEAALAVPDAPERALRLRAADALARAGLSRDAQAVYEGLLAGADEADTATLRRRLAALE